MTRNNYDMSICKRLSQAERVRFQEVSLPNWCPTVADCHGNVDKWVEANPGTVAVRGWVTYADFGLSIGLTAHSVVRGPDGQLFDITPLESRGVRPAMRFVPHLGDEQLFLSMKELNIFIECPSSDASEV
jgi:hypothetical protein